MTAITRFGVVVAVEPGAGSAEWADSARARGLDVRTVEGREAALAELRSTGGVDALVLDLTSGEGLELLREAHFLDRAVQRVLVGGVPQWEQFLEIFRRGRCFTVLTARRRDELVEKLELAVATCQRKRQEDAARRFAPVSEELGRTQTMRDAVAQVRRAVAAKKPVLLYGAISSGRALLAERVALEAGLAERDVWVVDHDSVGLVAGRQKLKRHGPEAFILRNIDRWPDECWSVAAPVLADDEARRRFQWFFTAAEAGVKRLAGVEAVRSHVPGLKERVDDVPPLATHFLDEACHRHRLIHPIVLGWRAGRDLARYDWVDGGLDELETWMEEIVRRRAESGHDGRRWVIERLEEIS